MLTSQIFVISKSETVDRSLSRTKPPALLEALLLFIMSSLHVTENAHRGSSPIGEAKMFSKENTRGMDPHSSIGASDVEDLLVAAIQQKLRLKAVSCYIKQTRTSPHKLPMRTTNNPQDIMTPMAADAVVKRCRRCYAYLTPISPCRQAADMCRICSLKTGSKTANNTRSIRTTDPYNQLQELLRDGTLVQEAIKRLQLGLPSVNNTNRSSTKFHYDDYDEISITASSATAL